MEKLTIPLDIRPDCLPLQLNWIPAGRFTMGSKTGRGLDEFTDSFMGEFKVILTKGYWLSIYPITQCQWQSVMGNNPSRFVGANLPVEMISWHDTLRFCERLHSNNYQSLKIPANYIFSLPTEAQWEYACKAGVTYKYQIGNSLKHLSQVAWHRGNIPNPSTQQVGQKKPNNWGFYDMLGNVMEWCVDSPIEYPQGTTQVDWIGQLDSKYHVMRGGSAFTPPDDDSITCSGRSYSSATPNVFFGFRLCLRHKIN